MKGGFRKHRGCVDHIFFLLRMVVEIMLTKGKKIYDAFMDLLKFIGCPVGCNEGVWCR